VNSLEELNGVLDAVALANTLSLDELPIFPQIEGILNPSLWPKRLGDSL
jgi:hypothetical protein